jgi:anaerobic selenocysteine-containing dehydrogenase
VSTRAFQPLQVVGFVATKRTDPERGPLVRIRPDDATLRLIDNGELVWVYGPRRHELAPVVYDESLPRGGVVVRDLSGLAVTEIVRLVKMDIDHRPVLTTHLA